MSEHSLDARGLICPLPVLKARKALQLMNVRDTLCIQVTDKAAIKDFQLFCNETGHTLKSVQDLGKYAEIVVEKA